jgi:hypothetical protein
MEVFFDMVTVPHLASKLYRQESWKEPDEMLSCFGELGVKRNSGKERSEELNED